MTRGKNLAVMTSDVSKLNTHCMKTNVYGFKAEAMYD